MAAWLACVLGALSGCFVLFPLDDYRGEADGATTGDERVVGDEGVTTDAPPGDAFVPLDGRVVFVLDPPLLPSEIAGLDGGDTRCTNAAIAAGLPGTRYRAWLSDQGIEFAARVDASVFDAKRSVFLIRPDHKTIAASFDELADTGPRVPIVVSARGLLLPVPDGGCVEAGFVWTDTNPNGTAAMDGYDCQQWTSTNGLAIAGRFGATEGGAWTNGCGDTFECATRGYLYCVEQ
jgi:hypothetical protein